MSIYDIITLKDFQSFKSNIKKNIARNQNDVIVSTLKLKIEQEISIHDNNMAQIFNKYINNSINNLMTYSKLLRFSENSWEMNVKIADLENAKNSKYNFDLFFSGYSSTLASIEMLSWFKNYDIFQCDEFEKKLNFIKSTYEISYNNFTQFHDNSNKLQHYNLTIPSFEDIKKSAKDIVEHFKNLQIINLFDNKYRDYLRSRFAEDVERFSSFEYYSPNFDNSIVDFYNLMTLTTYSTPNICSSIYSAYFDMFKVYRNIIYKDNSFNKFSSFQQNKINYIKSFYDKKDDTHIRNEKLQEIEDNEEKYKQIFNDNKKFFQTQGMKLQSLINSTLTFLQNFFNNQSSEEFITLTFTTENIIKGAFNNYQFYAFKDNSVLNISENAYFGFSINSDEKELITKFENLLSSNIDAIKNELNNIEDVESKINATNFLTPISMLEEFNTEYVQKYFFKTNKQHNIVLV